MIIGLLILILLAVLFPGVIRAVFLLLIILVLIALVEDAQKHPTTYPTSVGVAHTEKL